MNKDMDKIFKALADSSRRQLLDQLYTFELKPMDSTVKLTLKHEDLLPADFYEDEDTFVGYNNGWPAIMSNLKSLLETGHTLPAIVV